MIIDEILKNGSNNEALSKGSVRLTFKDLSHFIHLRAKFICDFETTLIINHKDPIKFCIDFLATSYLGKKVILGDFDSKASQDFIEIQDWDLSFEEEEELPNLKKKSEQFKFGILSSGSLSDPRVIWRSNDEWESAFDHQTSVFNISETNKLLVLDALTYSANLNATIHTLWNGGEVCFTSLKNAKNWSNEIVARSIDSIFLVPSHWKLLESSNQSFLNITSCVSAGEKLSTNTCRQLIDRFPSATITEYYGASELGHISYQQNDEIINNPLSVGRAFPGVTLKIIDQKIHVESPYVSAAFKQAGTVSDLGYIEDGRLILLGRAGRMFNKRGLNIYAQEIESVAQSHIGVDTTVLVKTKSDKLCLLYSLVSDVGSIPKVDLWSFLEEKLPKNKHPHFIQEVDYLPLTQSGKIDYQELQQSYESQQLLAST